MRVSDFIESSNCADTPKELAASFRVAISDCGYDRFAYGALTHYSQYKFKHPYQAPGILVEYPSDWVAHYFHYGYAHVDPIISRTPMMRWPYLWSELNDLTEGQQKFMAEANEAGLTHGICVPLHGPFGDTFAMSLASDYRGVAPRVVIDKLHVITAQFHTAFMRMIVEDPVAKPVVKLTPRETECLTWSSRGKSSWDIGMILGISENTVNFHIKNAMKKLDCSTRILAIVKVIRMGIIIP